jgi:hypothetical protein
MTVATGRSPTALVEAQPVTTMKDTAIHPNTVAERKLLAGFIGPLTSCASLYSSSGTNRSPFAGSLNLLPISLSRPRAWRTER